MFMYDYAFYNTNLCNVLNDEMINSKATLLTQDIILSWFRYTFYKVANTTFKSQISNSWFFHLILILSRN